MNKAMFYKPITGGNGSVRCYLCAHHCRIGPGKRGICAVRENRGGVLYSLVYGKVVAEHADPIEKKPLFHFMPGSRTYSIATAGCNFRCEHCQNYEISQFPRERPDLPIPGREKSPQAIVDSARAAGCNSISYTYTEPTIFLEFAADCAALARKSGIKNVFVSNGFMSPKSAAYIARLIDANNIDLKGGEGFYRDICHARLAPVLETIKIMKSAGVWVEITTLVIPGWNDSPEALRRIADFIASVDTAIPWHVSRFHPDYKLLSAGETPAETIRFAVKTGKEAGLKYVYSGNIAEPGGEDTVCPGCNNALVRRSGFTVLGMNISGRACPLCGLQIEGVWQ
ncbi:MAG: AmmeMemoRadiSam system radical SAM enzyme [Nitrospiraceae bacterium]|nr:AmmeMemoRadiSam system radical SAM enzyme [Nitrospiraceae bacterium]